MVFSHRPIQWKEQTWFPKSHCKFSSYGVASCIVVHLDGSKASMSSSSFVLWPNEVYILGHIFSGPSKKHEGVKIDPPFLIWSLLYHTKIRKNGSIFTRPSFITQTKYALKYKLHYFDLFEIFFEIELIWWFWLLWKYS